MDELVTDSRGSQGLIINKNENNKTYTKIVKSYLYKYVIKYINGLSDVLDIPIIKYDFIRKDGINYIKSESYDKEIDYDEIIIEPFYYSDIYDGIYMMKEFLSNYENGSRTYQEYLKQIVLALLINDADRTIANTKFYKKGNDILLAPYLDIHLAMNLDSDLPVFMDEYYFTKQEFDSEEIEQHMSYEKFMSYFEHDFNSSYGYLYNQCVFGEHSIQDIWKILYEEITDKLIFEKINKLEIDDVLGEKINDNAYRIISEQFNISKKILNETLMINKRTIK